MLSSYVLLLALATLHYCTALVRTTNVVSELMQQKQATVDSLKAVAPGAPELSRLRFALAFDTEAEATKALKTTVAWRAGTGKYIVSAAAKAVKEATRNPGEWDNEPVRLAAPHAATINQFITPKNIVTVSTNDGDLVYIIRASAISDNQLMRKVTVKQLSEFFAYVKEVHSIVANQRSEATGRLCEVIFANDISGIRLPPNSKFSEALTSSSKQYEQLYPSLAGPTMILNLPRILQAFIALFKPLFPKTVQDRLLFERAPFLASQKELTPLTITPSARDAFLAEVKKILR